MSIACKMYYYEKRYSCLRNHVDRDQGMQEKKVLIIICMFTFGMQSNICKECAVLVLLSYYLLEIFLIYFPFLLVNKFFLSTLFIVKFQFTIETYVNRSFYYFLNFFKRGWKFFWWNFNNKYGRWLKNADGVKELDQGSLPVLLHTYVLTILTGVVSD